jgi:hypothetical protein
MVPATRRQILRATDPKMPVSSMSLWTHVSGHRGPPQAVSMDRAPYAVDAVALDGRSLRVVASSIDMSESCVVKRVVRLEPVASTEVDSDSSVADPRSATPRRILPHRERRGRFAGHDGSRHGGRALPVRRAIRAAGVDVDGHSSRVGLWDPRSAQPVSRRIPRTGAYALLLLTDRSVRGHDHLPVDHGSDGDNGEGVLAH